MLRYFAYGSNLHPLRLRARAPSASVLSVAELRGYVLRFHKRGSDGSGKCDAHATGVERDRVPGVVYQLDPQDKAALDLVEGPGYRASLVRVEVDGRGLDALTYLAREGWIEPGLAPFDWYKQLVLLGARHHRLPPAHLRALEAVASVADPEPSRADHHQGLIRAIQVGVRG